jgi:2-polyprenyl-3-methyl-5-hydroxy-6-metoxy-1,4-benzoquinol methylase
MNEKSDMMSGYSVFARYYDELTANIDYKKRADYFHLIIQKFKQTENMLLLDLACGTGSISEEMAKLSYDVIGVDNSEEMLGIAIEKKFDSGLPIQYLCQDMREIDMFGTIDVTICALDSINHLPSFDDVKKTFSKVSLFAEPDGLFIFDINTIYKHLNILADNTFTYETDDVFLVWENKLNKSNYDININLEFFERDGDKYYRSTENFIEKAYETSDIDNALIETGFEILAHYDDDSFNPPNDNSQRIVIVARKIR